MGQTICLGLSGRLKKSCLFPFASPLLEGVGDGRRRETLVRLMKSMVTQFPVERISVRVLRYFSCSSHTHAHAHAHKGSYEWDATQPLREHGTGGLAPRACRVWYPTYACKGKKARNHGNETGMHSMSHTFTASREEMGSPGDHLWILWKGVNYDCSHPTH